MAPLPKLVRERLQQAAPGEHPGADALAAFAEHSLAGSERERVLEHLSRCAACREIAMLAMPEVERESLAVAAAPVSDRMPASGWTWVRWPAAGWAAAALCCAVLATAMLVHRGRQAAKLPGPDTVAVLQSTSPVAQASSKQAERAEKQPPKAGQRTAKSGSSAERMATLGHPSPTFARRRKANGAGIGGASRLQSGVRLKSRASATDDGLAHSRVATVTGAPEAKFANHTQPILGTGQGNGNGPVLADRAQAGPAPSAAPPAQPETAFAAGQMTQDSQKILEAQPARRSLAEAAPALVAGPPGAAAGRISAGAGGGAGGGIGSAASAAELRASPERWSLSEDGAIERSLNSGKTWTKVDVGNGKKFRALSAVGPDVWAGGAVGTLFHTSDGGMHWAQVQPEANGVTLSAAIVRIEFSDARHGRLVTETGEIWSTGDGGENWQRR